MKSAAPLILLIVLAIVGLILVTTKYIIPEIYRKKAEPFLPDIEAASKQYDLPDGLLARVAQQESGFDKMAVSPVGASGLFQFMPATAQDFGIDPFDPKASAFAAAKYLRQLYNQFGSWSKALAAYNWGKGNLTRKDLADGIFGDDLPDETRRYVAEITGDVGVT